MEEFVVNKQAIKELIKSVPQQISKLYVSVDARGEDIKEIILLARQNKVAFLSAPRQKLMEIYNKGYSGVLAVISKVKYYTTEEVLLDLCDDKPSIIVVLDEISDPQNFGSILRSCAAFEVDAVIIQQWNQAQVTQTVMDVSRGAVRVVPIVKEKNVYNAIKKLKEKNFWVYGTVVPSESNTDVLDFNNLSGNKIAVVFGNEHKGVRKNIISECDGVISIKHSQDMQSLNVSVACGIVLYELYKNLIKD